MIAKTMDTIFEEWKNRSCTGENVGGFLSDVHGHLVPSLVEQWIAESLGSYGLSIMDNLQGTMLQKYPSTYCNVEL